MMTPERWQKISEILEQALELAPEKRLRFVDLACSSDPSLRSEVQSFLSAHETSSPGFLDRPPLRSSFLSPGVKLGDYEIVSQLGECGTGVVYRYSAWLALRGHLSDGQSGHRGRGEDRAAEKNKPEQEE
jgi:eukaryotic-like serine/threonine-protein kinase